jgi:hypothetical protein
LLNCCYNEFKYILDHPTVPTVFYVVCQTISAVVLWGSEFNGGSKQEFYVQYWRISQSSPSMLSPTIHDPCVTADLQYTVKNLVPDTIYIFHIFARNILGDSFTKSMNCTTDRSRYSIVDLYSLTRSVLSISFCFTLISYTLKAQTSTSIKTHKSFPVF